MFGPRHKRRINIEDKAKVVAAIWGEEFIKYLAALAAFHWDDLKNRLKCTGVI